MALLHSCQQDPVAATTEKPNYFHAVQFYTDARTLAARVAAFADEGLRRRQPVLLVTRNEHATAITRALEALEADVAAARRSGALQILDARKMLGTLVVGGKPDPLLFKSNMADIIERLCDGRERQTIRVYGEMVDLLWQEGHAEGAILLETLWNQLSSTYEFELLCGYGMKHFRRQGKPGYDQVCDLHSRVFQPA